MNLFNIDSPLYKYMTLAFDIMFIGLLWLVTSVPVITIGASTAAAYYVMMRRITDREQAVFKDYFRAFKSNFKHATALWLILAVFFAVNLFNFLFFEYSGTVGMIAFAFFILFAIEIVFLFIHAFPMMARFEMSFLQTVKSTMLMAHKHLLTTVTHLVLLAALYFLFMELPIALLLIAFGPYCWLSSMMFNRLYKKYRPELDGDEDEQEETQEQNGG